jgi:hypothetical protein
MSEQAETKEVKKKKPPFKKDIEWLSDTINIASMYEIRGLQGLFMPKTETNKSGLVRMQPLSLGDAYTVNEKTLDPLATKVIYKSNGKAIILAEALDNLQKQFDNKPTGELDDGTIDILKGAICPGYHPLKFKRHHAKKIISWYNEIITVIKKTNDE